jgi:hypothetical protein
MIGLDLSWYWYSPKEIYYIFKQPKFYMKPNQLQLSNTGYSEICTVRG